jgi:hypothetical protein
MSISAPTLNLTPTSDDGRTPPPWAAGDNLPPVSTLVDQHPDGVFTAACTVPYLISYLVCLSYETHSLPNLITSSKPSFYALQCLSADLDPSPSMSPHNTFTCMMRSFMYTHAVVHPRNPTLLWKGRLLPASQAGCVVRSLSDSVWLDFDCHLINFLALVTLLTSRSILISWFVHTFF